MSELSKNVKTTFHNMITIYRETANLLQDADGMLEKLGYRCWHSNPNTIGTERSYQLNAPEWWITPYACRYFATAENPSEIKAIGVFFVDTEVTPIEPVILAGCFRMKKNDQGEILDYDYWYLKESWFHLVPEQELRCDLEVPGHWNFSAGKVRAVPLADVHDQQTLQQNVVEPLIAMSC